MSPHDTDTPCVPSRWAWGGWGLPRKLDDVRFLDVAAVLLVAFTVWGRVDVAPRGRIDGQHPEYHRTDFTVFTEAGAAFLDGREPYRVTNPRGWFYLYPPLFALTVAPLARFDTVTQVAVWYAVSVAAGFGCYFESRRIWSWLRGGNPRPRPAPGTGHWVGLAAGAAVLLPALECLQRGQLGIVLLYAQLLGLRLYWTSRGWQGRTLAGVVLAWPVVVKLIPALPVVCLVLQEWAGVTRRSGGRESARRSTALTGGLVLGAMLFLLAVPGLTVGWWANLRHLSTWAREVVTDQKVGRSRGFHVDSVSNQSLANAAHRLAARVTGNELADDAFGHWYFRDKEVARRREADVSTKRLVQVARVGLLGLLLAVAVVTGRRGETTPHARAVAVGLGSIGIVLVSPLAWTHYFVLWGPAILLAVPALLGDGRRRLAVAAAAVPGVLTLGHYLAVRRTGPIGLLGLGTAVWFVGVSVLVLVRGRSAVKSDGWRADAARGHEPTRIQRPLGSASAARADGPAAS